jgi:serine/threonine-protein kinase
MLEFSIYKVKGDEGVLSQGSTIDGRYSVEELIAPGGMGSVWKCKDSRLERYVALKTVLPHYVRIHPEAKEILQDEAKAAAPLLGHPNIVSVLDVGDHPTPSGSIPFIVIEYIPGITVDEWIAYKKILDGETYFNISLYIALEICKGIEFAHLQNVPHRDIKPLNAFISSYGKIKVGDFGLARLVDALTRLHTVKGHGTPAYTAPEQWRGEKYTIDTDIYQLGCTLYHLFTGTIPFEGDQHFQMYSHLNQDPKEPQTINPLICNEISTAIMNCILKKPDDRYALWHLHDIISKEIQHSFTMTVNVNKNNAKRNILVNITNFDEEGIRKNNGKCIWNYPDYDEGLSEGLQLVLSGITELKIYKSVYNDQKETAATTEP